LRESNLVCFKKEKEREREEKEEGSKAQVPPFIRVLETDPSKIALLIYEILGTNPCS
jgi:hypothetical protein